MGRPKFISRPEYHEVANMNHKTLVREVIARGAPFEYVINTGDLNLANWFIRNYYTTKRDLSLIDKYDEWLHAGFKANGRDPKNPQHKFLFDPRLNYGYVAETDSKTGKVTKERRIKGMSKTLTIKRKEKDKAFGIFKGTKKDLTFQCASKGLPIDETIRIVTESFPEAVEKSIKIWYSRAKKEKERLLAMRPELKEEFNKPLELKTKKKLVLKKEKPVKKLILKTPKTKLVLKLKK